MINVVNKYHIYPLNTDFDISRNSVLGNPYTHLDDSKGFVKVDTRKIAVESYSSYINDIISNKQNIDHLLKKYNWLTERMIYQIINMLNCIYRKAILSDIRLVCYCKPASCHGDIIKELVENKIKILIKNN